MNQKEAPGRRSGAADVPTARASGRRSSRLRWGGMLLIGMAVVALTVGVAMRRGASATGKAPLPTGTAPAAFVATVATPTAAATLAQPAPTAEPLPSPTSTPGLADTPPAPTQVDRGPCRLYDTVAVDLLTYVGRDTALDSAFVPDGLSVVPLDTRNLAFRPVEARSIIHRPLLDMLDAMNQAGLSVWVMSGYRSYGEQKLAYEKWQALYPDRAPELSAAPGRSEHQLGTAVDFSTPYMVDQFGDFFHVNFFQTPEGQWLLRQAPYYGFTLSYPAWAAEITGYSWEPWHFRYVGSLAEELSRRNITLIQNQRECGPPGT